MKSIYNKIICWLSGHRFKVCYIDWMRLGDPQPGNTIELVWECTRCGKVEIHYL